jgi:hypothetical protein
MMFTFLFTCKQKTVFSEEPPRKNKENMLKSNKVVIKLENVITHLRQIQNKNTIC